MHVRVDAQRGGHAVSCHLRRRLVRHAGRRADEALKVIPAPGPRGPPSDMHFALRDPRRHSSQQPTVGGRICLRRQPCPSGVDAAQTFRACFTREARVLSLSREWGTPSGGLSPEVSTMFSTRRLLAAGTAGAAAAGAAAWAVVSQGMPAAPLPPEPWADPASTTRSRREQLAALRAGKQFDVLIIGGESRSHSRSLPRCRRFATRSAAASPLIPPRARLCGPPVSPPPAPPLPP